MQSGKAVGHYTDFCLPSCSANTWDMDTTKKNSLEKKNEGLEEELWNWKVNDAEYKFRIIKSWYPFAGNDHRDH